MHISRPIYRETDRNRESQREAERVSERGREREAERGRKREREGERGREGEGEGERGRESKREVGIYFVSLVVIKHILSFSSSSSLFTTSLNTTTSISALISFCE